MNKKLDELINDNNKFDKFVKDVVLDVYGEDYDSLYVKDSNRCKFIAKIIATTIMKLNNV